MNFTGKNIIIITDSPVYEHRADQLFEHFRSRGCNVKVYTTDFDHMKKIKRENVNPEYTVIHGLPYMKNISYQRIRYHQKFAKDALKAVRNEHPDIIWVLVPSNSLVKSISKIKSDHPDTKLVFDVIDMWPETMPSKKLKKIPFANSIWAGIRNKHIDNADLVITECNLYQSILKAYVAPEKMKTLYLARKSYDIKTIPNPPEDRYSLCYLGSINNIIDITAICKIINLLKAVRPVDLHIIGEGENKELFIEDAKKSGANVIDHGTVYDTDKKQEIFDSCHFGINIMKEEVFIGLTMKSMDYFAGGLPIINNIKGDTWSFVEENNIGVNYTGDITLDQMYKVKRSNVRPFFDKVLSEDCFIRETDEIMCMLLSESEKV